MTNAKFGDIIHRLPEGSKQNLGVAQLGARYLGVVEAAGSSPVTQSEKALETLMFLVLFSFSVTQFSPKCYTICYTADGQLQ